MVDRQPPSSGFADVPGLPAPIWFVVSLVVYVVAGLVLKSVVLNWIVGPLWLLVTIVLIPAAVRRLSGDGTS